MLNGLLLVFSLTLIAVLPIVIWFNTKSGKKWLAEN